MPNVIVCRSELRFDVDEISGFRDPEEIFARRYGVRPRVAGVKLDMVRKSLLATDQQAVVVRCTRVLIRSDRTEHRVWTRTIEEESRMGSISEQRWSICIALTEEAEAELSDVLDSAFEG